MSKNRIEICTVENGYEVIVWKEEGEKDDYGYIEPKKYVAKDQSEVMTLVEDNL